MSKIEKCFYIGNLGTSWCTDEVGNVLEKLLGKYKYKFYVPLYKNWNKGYCFVFFGSVDKKDLKQVAEKLEKGLWYDSFGYKHNLIVEESSVEKFKRMEEEGGVNGKKIIQKKKKSYGIKKNSSKMRMEYRKVIVKKEVGCKKDDDSERKQIIELFCDMTSILKKKMEISKCIM